MRTQMDRGSMLGEGRGVKQISGYWGSNALAHEGQFSGPDAAGGNDGLSELAELSGLSLHDDDLGTFVAVQVYVLAAENAVMGFVLHVCERLREGVAAMIEDDAEDGEDVGGGSGPLLLDKGVADKVADGLGSAGVGVFAHPGVKLFE